MSKSVSTAMSGLLVRPTEPHPELCLIKHAMRLRGAQFGDILFWDDAVSIAVVQPTEKAAHVLDVFIGLHSERCARIQFNVPSQLPNASSASQETPIWGVFAISRAKRTVQGR